MSRFFLYILCFSTLCYPVNCRIFLSNKYKVAKGLTTLSVKAGFNSDSINEVIANLLYDGVERNFLTNKQIGNLIKRLKKSKDKKGKDYIAYFKDLQSKISKKQKLALNQRDSNIKYLLNSDLDIKTKNLLLKKGTKVLSNPIM